MIDKAFSFMAIVKTLALFRAKEANLRHRESFYWQRFKSDYNPSGMVFSDVAQYLPPRREWARQKKEHRHSSNRPSVDISHDAIYRKVQGVYYAGRMLEYEWGRKLSDLVKRVQNRVAMGDFKFERPELMLRTKAVGEGCQPKFRCISAYRNLEDRVILSIANKCLTSKLDGLLSNNSYAFRIGKKNPVARAVGKIIDFRKCLKAVPLYVAECDIVKFFDTIEHAAVLKVFEGVCDKVQLGNKAKALVKAFLESYDVRDIMSSGFWDKLAKTGDWDFLEELPKDSRIGLPQGGALSGLLSNLVLDNVDKAISELKLTDFLYVRYCDDIIMCAQSKDDCKKALGECSASLEKLSLKMYPANPDISYGADYYVAKSKGPFLWGNPTVIPNAIPWVSFLGYSIRYDGSARLRKETLLGHVKSIREECETFLFNVDNFGFRHPAERQKVIESFLYRLLAKGTGRINIEPIKGLGRCWLSVFRFIGESDAGLKQMRYLDYVRSFAVDRLLKKLGVRLGDDKNKGKRETLYLGKPFSYYGSCERLKRKLISEAYDLSVFDNEVIDNKSIDSTGDNDRKPVSNTDDGQKHEDTHKENDESEEPDIQDEEWVVSNWGRASGFGG